MATANNQRTGKNSGPKNNAHEKAFRDSRATTGAGLKTEGSSVEDPDQDFDQEEMEATADRDARKDMGRQVRGRELKQKMIESAEEGEAYRAEHQGADEIKPSIAENSHNK